MSIGFSCILAAAIRMCRVNDVENATKSPLSANYCPRVIDCGLDSKMAHEEEYALRFFAQRVCICVE